MLLQAANRRYGLIESLAACLHGRRQSGKVMARSVANRMPTMQRGYSTIRSTSCWWAAIR